MTENSALKHLQFMAVRGIPYLVKVAYSRCNGGHYFRGAFCPLDGSSSSASEQLDETCQWILARGYAICLDALLEEGISRRYLDRILVIEFGSDAAVFDAIAPEGGEDKVAGFKIID